MAGEGAEGVPALRDEVVARRHGRPVADQGFRRRGLAQEAAPLGEQPVDVAAAGGLHRIEYFPGAGALGYERAHRLVHYEVDAEGRPLPNGAYMLKTPPQLQNAPNNGGLEAMTVLADGRLLAITEELETGDGLAGWIIAGDTFEPLSYVAMAGFNPTDATTLPNGDVLVLERRFTLFERVGRIVRIRAADIRPGARLMGAEVARIAPPLQTDNFEGIDAVPDPQGGIRLFLEIGRAHV